MNDEPAYTPKVEYQCDGSTTHYQGCKCHEARRNEEIRSLSERVQEFTLQLRILRDDIIENAKDVYWCGPAETVCERITSILGDKWGEDGDVRSLRSRQACNCGHDGNSTWRCPHGNIVSGNARASNDDSLVKQMWDADQKVYRAQETQLKETRRLLDWIASACGTPDAAEGCRNILARIREFKSRE